MCRHRCITTRAPTSYPTSISRSRSPALRVPACDDGGTREMRQHRLGGRGSSPISREPVFPAGWPSATLVRRVRVRWRRFVVPNGLG